MLFAFDLDGTIVTKDNHLPGDIRDAIRALRRAGHIVTVITGRHHSGARAVLRDLEVDAHFGTCNGARVHAHGDAHHLELHLGEDVVRDLLKRFGDDDSSVFFLSTRDRMFVADPADPRWDWARADGRALTPAHAYDGSPAHKFIVTHDRAADLHTELTASLPGNTYYLWHGTYLEVVAPGGDKGNALARLAAHYGVPQEETVAFGDGPNDVEMLRWAGRAIGVGHLAPGVADVIDGHIPAPEELGVATWLRTHVLSSSVRLP